MNERASAISNFAENCGNAVEIFSKFAVCGGLKPCRPDVRLAFFSKFAETTRSRREKFNKFAEVVSNFAEIRRSEASSFSEVAGNAVIKL